MMYDCWALVDLASMTGMTSVAQLFKARPMLAVIWR